MFWVAVNTIWAMNYDIFVEPESLDDDYSLVEATSFRTFDQMKNSKFKQFKYGFPPGIYGSELIPIRIWIHVWCSAPIYGKISETFLFWK